MVNVCAQEVSENIVNSETIDCAIEDDAMEKNVVRSIRRHRVDRRCFGPMVSKCQGQIYTYTFASITET